MLVRIPYYVPNIGGMVLDVVDESEDEAALRIAQDAERKSQRIAQADRAAMVNVSRALAQVGDALTRSDLSGAAAALRAAARAAHQVGAPSLTREVRRAVRKVQDQVDAFAFCQGHHGR